MAARGAGRRDRAAPAAYSVFAHAAARLNTIACPTPRHPVAPIRGISMDTTADPPTTPSDAIAGARSAAGFSGAFRIRGCSGARIDELFLGP